MAPHRLNGQDAARRGPDRQRGGQRQLVVGKLEKYPSLVVSSRFAAKSGKTEIHKLGVVGLFRADDVTKPMDPGILLAQKPG